MRQRADGSGTADQRREQMLRAALEVIDERGYPETRIADVAERAGASPALVIYYFKTKNQLLTEAMRFSEDRWYETGTSRIAAIDTAAGRLEELVAMTCLPEADTEPNESWLVWLDLWAQAGRHPEVASVRRKFDERWRETIYSPAGVPTFALNFYSPIVAEQLRTGRKTATIRLGDKSPKYRKGMIVTVLVGARYGQREKIFDAVIDKVEVKRLGELSPREIEHDNPEIRRADELAIFLSRLYNREVTEDDIVTLIRFSQIVGTMF